MEHAQAFEPGSEVLQDGGGVFIRVPGVDHHRHAQITGDLQVFLENSSLHVVRGLVVVIIQSDLAHRHHLGKEGVLAHEL